MTSAADPSVLFLGDNKEDYLSDSLLHGLRTLLGDRMIDYPKREIMYTSYPPDARSRLYGRGFTLYGQLDEVDVSRVNIAKRLGEGEFDLVVFGDIWHDFGMFVEHFPYFPRGRTAIVDGTDSPLLYPFGPRFWRVPQWWTLPRAHRCFAYFKRELSRWSTLLRLPGDLRPISFSIPEEKIVPAPPEKMTLFQTHIVDEEVALALGRGMEYAFDDENEYYADLRAARFGITTRRAGWDCMRHYEIAACGTVPCFRDLDRKPPRSAPHGLIDGVNCLAYASYEDLKRRIESLTAAHFDRLQAGALAWARANCTEARAAELLASMGHPSQDDD